MPRFLQIHWLSSYPATLLNRDDIGFAKRIPFGGVTRLRISSQCLKRHWRMAGAANAREAQRNPWALQNLEHPMGVRTKEVVEQMIIPLALSRQPAAEGVVAAVTEALLKELYGKNAVDPKKRQILFVGEPEVEYLARLAAQVLAEPNAGTAAEQMAVLLRQQRKNLRQLKLGAGLGAALFGRMITSDPAANTYAAIHVAHALTVHGQERDLDFMTVVDDLKSTRHGDDAGAAGIFDLELTCGLYYGYVVVDVPLLISNMAGDTRGAAKVTEHLVHLIAEVSPGAKKGSTAPYAWAEYLLLESGARQPRTLANAFRNPVSLQTNNLLDAALHQLHGHMQNLDAGYGSSEIRRQMCVEPGLALEGVESASVNQLAQWAAEQVAQVAQVAQK